MSDPTRWKKKPIIIEAMWWNGTRAGADQVLAWVRARGGVAYLHVECGGGDSHLLIRTLEGDTIAGPDVWVIRGVQGEFYPVHADIFYETYERMATTADTQPVLRPEPAADPLAGLLAAHHLADGFTCWCGTRCQDYPGWDRHLATLIRQAHPYVDADDGDVNRIARARRLAGSAEE